MGFHRGVPLGRWGCFASHLVFLASREAVCHIMVVSFGHCGVEAYVHRRRD
jgi:hypothetical protein